MKGEAQKDAHYLKLNGTRFDINSYLPIKRDETSGKKPLKKMRQDQAKEEQEENASQGSAAEPSEDSDSTRRVVTKRRNSGHLKKLEVHQEETKRVETEIKQIIDVRMSSPNQSSASSRDGSYNQKKTMRKKPSGKSPKKAKWHL